MIFEVQGVARRFVIFAQVIGILFRFIKAFPKLQISNFPNSLSFSAFEGIGYCLNRETFSLSANFKQSLLFVGLSAINH